MNFPGYVVTLARSAQDTNDESRNTTTMLAGVAPPMSSSVSAETVPHLRHLKVRTCPAYMLSSNAMDTWQENAQFDLNRRSIGSVFSRDVVVPPSTGFDLSKAQELFSRHGRSAALDALLDYLDDLVIIGDVATLDRWLQNTRVSGIAAELLVATIAALKPICARLPSYNEYVAEVRAYLTRVEGIASTQRLLDGVV